MCGMAKTCQAVSFKSLLSCQTRRVFPLLTLHTWAQTDLQNDPGVEDLQLQKT